MLVTPDGDFFTSCFHLDLEVSKKNEGFTQEDNEIMCELGIFKIFVQAHDSVHKNTKSLLAFFKKKNICILKIKQF